TTHYRSRNVGTIGEDLQNVSSQIDNQVNMMSEIPVDQLGKSNAQLGSLIDQKSALNSSQRLGRGVLYGGGAALAGGALYGGKKLYDHMQDNSEEEKIAGVLPVNSHDGTLNVVTETETNGGIQKMSKKLVEDFLKVAGASGLVTIANGEEYDMELRKEASDAFDHIANLGDSAMTEALVKVAQEIY